MRPRMQWRTLDTSLCTCIYVLYKAQPSFSRLFGIFICGCLKESGKELEVHCPKNLHNILPKVCDKSKMASWSRLMNCELERS